MRRPVLMATFVITALIGVVVVPAAQAAPACKNLLVDPAGDADHLNTGEPGRMVEDGRVVDLLSADLASDRKQLTVVMRTKGKRSEGGTDYLDHSWTLSFSTASERFHAAAYQTKVGGAHFNLWRVIAGDDVPEDEGGPSGSVGEGVDTVVTGTIDEAKGLIRMQVPLDAFAEFGGLGAKLTRIRVITWSGNGAYDKQAGNIAGSYGSTDFGRTDTSYRVGARGCV
ncbi:MAG TPA: hypothetical protein VNA30_06445 [Mycobacteriales bacterium]|nr:hypothetical protein [Mycobacteriales bacterium]